MDGCIATYPMQRAIRMRPVLTNGVMVCNLSYAKGKRCFSIILLDLEHQSSIASKLAVV
jgi:hypothetical protein